MNKTEPTATATKHNPAPAPRLTRLRRQILDFLAAAGGPVKAYAIIDALRGAASKPLTPASVYRALDFLQRHGLAHRVGTLNAFVACTSNECRSGHEPVFMLVCDGCRQSRELSDPSLYKTIFAAMKAQGFDLQGETIELTGICPQCAQNAGAPSAKNHCVLSATISAE